MTSVSLVVLALACAAPAVAPSPSPESDLRFTVVAEGQATSSYGFDTLGSSPRLVVGAAGSARTELDRLVGRSLQGDLLLGVFQGVQRTGGHGVTVERVRLGGGQVVVSARFTRPSPDAIVTQVLTSPFAVVSVARGDLPTGRTRFVLKDQSGATVTEVDVTLD